MRLDLRETGKSAMRIVGLALAVALVPVLAGCSAEVNVGGGSEASGEEIAGEIRDDYAERTGIELTKLTCEGVEVEVGETFECSGRNERSVQLEIAGEVTDTESGGFDYNWKVVQGTAPGVLYERALQRQLEERGVGISAVRCPLEVEIEVGSKVHCEATDVDGSTRGATLTLTDLDGGFDYAVDGGESGESSGERSPS